MSPGRENRPAVNGAALENQPGGLLRPMVPLDPRDEVARLIDGAFVLIVSRGAGRSRRRCYLTVRAAEGAARKAADRGETATILLAELKPLFRVIA